VKRLLLVVLVLAAAGVAPGRADAARECQGLMVCIPVAGPWVAVPAPRGVEAVPVQFLLSCPKGSVVAGTDALVSDRALDVEFLGTVGAPVGPGVTTHEAVLFVATYSGAARRPSGFQPYLGCVPAQGGGGRATTAFHPFAAQAFPPGEPLVRRMKVLQLTPNGATIGTAGCNKGERLVGSAHAIAFPQMKQPPIEWLADVRGARRIVDGRVAVSATRGDAIPARTKVLVQILAVCAKPG
jgi:hypothetical protein